MRATSRISLCLAVVLIPACEFSSSGSSDGSQLGDTTDATASATSGTDAASTDPTAEDGSGTSVAGSTSVGSDEPCVDVCADGAPEGWAGPHYVATATDAVDCPDGYARQDLAFAGFEAQPATCECSCASSEGSCAIGYQISLAGLCLGPVVDEVLADGACDDWGTITSLYMVANVVGNPGTCEAQEVNMVPPVQWSTAATMCAAPARGGDCGEDRCTAQPPAGLETRLCISRSGENECPGGDYTDRSVYYRSNEDTRTCSACTCDGETGVCGGQIRTFDSLGCPSGGGTDRPLGSCESMPVSGDYSVGAVVTGNAANCSAAEMVSMGEATPTGAVTVCCA